MKNAQEKLQAAMAHAMEYRPKVGGFPFLAECLRQAGVTHNIWSLPAVQSVYIMSDGACVVDQGTPLVTGMALVPTFDETAVIAAIRADQAGESTFPEFLQAIWRAGAWGYDVDFAKRTVTYMGARGELYTEAYLSVEVSGLEVSMS